MPIAFVGGAVLAPVMVSMDTLLHEWSPRGARGLVFSSRDLPADIPEVLVAAPGATVLLSKLLVSAGLVTSNSEARRLMEQGAVRVDGEAYRDAKSELPTTRPEPLLIQVGKRRIARVRFTA
jgi:tyrosyl-tRNA synthetase